MADKTLSVDVCMDAKIFRAFTVFDSVFRKHQWRRLVIFAAIMTVFACVCFAMSFKMPEAPLLGIVLLVIGLGLPGVSLLNFSRSLKLQAAAHKLSKPRLVYSLSLSGKPDGIAVENPGGESAVYKWADIYGAYRVKDYIYLYIIERRAFILPDAQVKAGPDALWSLLCKVLPPEKLRDRRKKTG